MYLDACQSMGCQKSDLFQTVDLYELQNIPQVSQKQAVAQRHFADKVFLKISQNLQENTCAGVFFQ